MTYQPKHRGEPFVKYQIIVIESERGWGRDEWTEEFDTHAEAEARIISVNSHHRPGPAPDYYVKALPTIRRITM